MSKESVKAAALELFGRISYVKTSVSDIASAAGIGKGSVYLAFKSKEEILFALLDDELEEIRRESDPRFFDPDRGFGEKLDLFTQMVVDQHFRIRNLMFGSFENVEGRDLRDVYHKFSFYIDRVAEHFSRVAALHGAEPGPELRGRIREYLLTISGRILIFILSRDWNSRDEVQREILPWSRLVFAALVRSDAGR